MENKIVMIAVEKLHPHPNNPRKRVGDVSELAESIKKSGVLQNLTVVPWISPITGKSEEDEYTVIIGHRRFAASKEAGLTELPCIVKEMTTAEQLATMLAENVQRNDLTPIEQAEGIQMMFDIGETVSDVVQKTGLSESTVRRRAKLLELDREQLRRTEGRGATLADYEKLNQIEDIKVRNKVLESIGTNNFNMEVSKAIQEQKKEKTKKALFEQLDTFATKVTTYPTGCTWVTSWSFDSGCSVVDVPKDAGEAEYYYYPNSYNVVLYKKVTSKKLSKAEVAKEEQKREAERKESERRNKIAKLAEEAYSLRKKFIEEFNPTKKHEEAIKMFLWNMFIFGDGRPWLYKIDEFCKTTFKELDTYEEKSTAADGYFEEQPEKAMLVLAYLLCDDDKYKYVQTWNGRWEESPEVDKLYECLERLGYQISDEEKKLQDGTHELFAKEA